MSESMRELRFVIQVAEPGLVAGLTDHRTHENMNGIKKVDRYAGSGKANEVVRHFKVSGLGQVQCVLCSAPGACI